jgi:hypothetical protein
MLRSLLASFQRKQHGEKRVLFRESRLFALIVFFTAEGAEDTQRNAEETRQLSLLFS